MQKQKPSFLDILKNLHCPKHNQPLVLVCIEKECSRNDRTFCFQCNDQSQLNKNTHILISIKKFDAMYNQYNPLLKASSKVSAKQKLIRLKQRFLDDLNEIQSLLSTESSQDFVNGQQEQIVKGKINNLLKNYIWAQIFDMKNNKSSEQEIFNFVKTKSQNKNIAGLEGIEQVQKNITLQIQKFITQLKNGQNKPVQTNRFSNERKNTNLKLSKDQKAVSNLSEYGHYFCLTEKDFDIHNTTYKFNIGKISSETSYWFGFTFPSISQRKKWINIYDQNLGGFFIVVFQKGKKINFWNHEKAGFSNSEQISISDVLSYSSIQLSINFEAKQLNFNIIIEGKKIAVKAIRPQKWHGKIYPCVGFYGKQGAISIQ